MLIKKGFSMNKYMVSSALNIKQILKVMDVNLINTVFVEKDGTLLGVVSGGDIRRALLDDCPMSASVMNIMNPNPICIEFDCSEDKLKKLFVEKKISAIPIVDKGRVVKVIARSEILEPHLDNYKKLSLPVVIMAGGKGTRLDPFTRILPKPLIPIGDKPIIEIVMDEFSKHGMIDFHVSVNFKADMIKAYFNDGECCYNIDYLVEKKPLGTAGALHLLKAKFKSPFFVSNCDSIIKSEYSDIYNFHQAGSFDMTLVASMQHHVIPYGVCELADGGCLKTINEKPEYDLMINTGMYLLNPSVLDYIKMDTIFHMTDLIDELQKNGLKVGVFPVSEKSWIDMGQWREYKEAVKKFDDLMKD